MKEIFFIGRCGYGMNISLPPYDWRAERDTHLQRKYVKPRQHSKTKRSNVKRRRKK